MSSGEKDGAGSDEFIVELSLVDLSQDLEDDSHSGEKLPKKLDALLETLSCSSADAVLSPPPPPPKKNLWNSFRKAPPSEEEEVLDRIRKQVTRFLKPPDKYISLTSILLKSQAFHKTHRTEDGTPSECLRVVEIPRTEYKKPYIPSKTKHDAFPEVNLYPLSISHQFPFVGMARLVINEASKEPQNRPLVGLDIVTFDDYNPRLYDSVNAFLEVFRTSFSPWEWDCIQAQEDVLLKEFYLRWSTKEAYTKALGVGMGLSFESFETHLEGLEEKGIYTWLEEVTSKQIAGGESFFLTGTVVLKPNTPESKSEQCSFLFYPLWKRTKERSTIDSALGCGCLCMANSVVEGKENAVFRLATNWNRLDDLVVWHESSNNSTNR